MKRKKEKEKKRRRQNSKASSVEDVYDSAVDFLHSDWSGGVDSFSITAETGLYMDTLAVIRDRLYRDPSLHGDCNRLLR